MQERISNLVLKGAISLEIPKIEAYYLPASLVTNHVIIFAQPATFWRLHPKYYDNLKDHADVVVWNPTQLTPVQYQQDLQSVIEKVRSLHPRKTMTVIGRCATVDPVIAAASELKDRKINLVLDRGHGNVRKLARFRTFFSLLPAVQKILTQQFDCKGESRIQEVSGKILFIRSEQDQLMRKRKEDLTTNLITLRGHRDDDRVLDLHPSDHWTPWNQRTCQEIYDFIGLKDVNVSAFPQMTTPPTLFARKILPLLIQSWC